MKLTHADYSAMSTEELREINQMVYSILKRRKSVQIEEVKYQISVGSKVRVKHEKTSGELFTVTEIRRKRATVKDQYGSSLNVPIALIELAK